MKKWLIIYDIKDAHRLTKVMKIVSEYATRVQLSIYEMEDTVGTVDRIKERVGAVIDKDVDFVIYFDVCETDWQKIEKYGKADGITPQQEYYIL